MSEQRDEARCGDRVGSRLAGTAIAVFLAFAVCAVLILLVGANPRGLRRDVGGLGRQYCGLDNDGRAHDAPAAGRAGSGDQLPGRRVQHWGGGATYLGAIGATIVGLMPLGVPGWIHVPLALLGGIAGGAIWAAIPGYLPSVPRH